MFGMGSLTELREGHRFLLDQSHRRRGGLLFPSRQDVCHNQTATMKEELGFSVIQEQKSASTSLGLHDTIAVLYGPDRIP